MIRILLSGFNSTLRRGNVTHHEYIQVGKGRDVGLNQISLFEAKVACGNGEQILSRDIYRLGHRFDFFRMLSCYFTTVGFYISSMVTSMSFLLNERLASARDKRNTRDYRILKSIESVNFTDILANIRVILKCCIIEAMNQKMLCSHRNNSGT